MLLFLNLIETFPASNVLGLLKLAHLYECQTLLDRCESHLMNCVEIPLWELLTFADLYGLNKLQAILFSYEKNFKQ
jgi:hypothetical protein